MSITDTLQQMLQERINQGPQIVNDYKSSLGTAATQDQQSIDQLRGVYNNPALFNKSVIGALGLGMMQGTKSGTFNEGMYNALSAATQAKDYNREQQLSREEKLAKLGALEAQLTRQKAQDTLGVYDAQTGLINGSIRDQGTLSDIGLQKNPIGSRPLAAGAQGPVAPDQSPFAHSMLVYNDYLANPQKYSGPQGQAMVSDAIRLIQTERTNQRYESLAKMRYGNQNGERVMPNSPEGRRISSRLKGYDEEADAGREMMSNVSTLKEARSKIGYEGAPGAGLYASSMGWLMPNAAAGQEVNARATNFKLDLSKKLKGAISDREQAMLSSASPGLDMSDSAAGGIMDGYNAAGQRAIEHSKFMKEWYRANGNDYGADEAWDQYINDNPIVSQDDKGNLSINTKNVGNWRDYLNAGGGSGAADNGQDSGQPGPSMSPEEVVGSDSDGNPITWGDIETTAQENGLTVQQVIERLKGGK